MHKYSKILVVAMVVLTTATLNLSTSCQPPSSSTGLNEVAAHRRDLMAESAADSNTAEAETDLIASIEGDAVLFESGILDLPVGAPAELSWRTLTDVEFKDVYVDELDAYYWKPTFGPSVKALEGKEVYITGYVIPVDYDEDFYVVSRYPFANCFFCGGAGPESVVDLRFKGKTRRYETDERLTFKGVFALNANDIYQMNYILEGVVEFKP